MVVEDGPYPAEAAQSAAGDSRLARIVVVVAHALTVALRRAVVDASRMAGGSQDCDADRVRRAGIAAEDDETAAVANAMGILEGEPEKRQILAVVATLIVRLEKVWQTRAP